MRLVSFVYRTSRPGQPRPLRHQPTVTQLAALDRIEACATEAFRLEGAATPYRDRVVVSEVSHDSSHSQAATTIITPARRAIKQLDRACLDLAIALLDYELRGDLFESPVVGFLAAIGVDAENQTYRDPSSYTGYLSGLVKISQMLVAQRAV